MPNIEIFSQNLLKRRKKQGMTQAALANEAGISVQTISAYENGTKSPSLATAIDLSNVLGISLDELCSESDTNLDTPHTFTKVESLADIVALIDLLKQGLSLFERPCIVSSEGTNVEIKIEDCKDLAEYYSKYLKVLELQTDDAIFDEMIAAWKSKMIDSLKSKDIETFELFGF